MARCGGRFGGLGDDSDDDDVNEVEMLLEAVFIQVGSPTSFDPSSDPWGGL